MNMAVQLTEEQFQTLLGRLSTGNSNNEGVGVMAGAAVVGGAAVGVVAGPMLGVVAAGGAAYAATRNDKVGDVAKSTGRAAVAVGSKAVRTAVCWNALCTPSMPHASLCTPGVD